MASGHGECAGLGGWGSFGSSSISPKTSDGAGVGDGEWGAQPEIQEQLCDRAVDRSLGPWAWLSDDPRSTSGVWKQQ